MCAACVAGGAGGAAALCTRQRRGLRAHVAKLHRVPAPRHVAADAELWLRHAHIAGGAACRRVAAEPCVAVGCGSEFGADVCAL